MAFYDASEKWFPVVVGLVFAMMLQVTTSQIPARDNIVHVRQTGRIDDYVTLTHRRPSQTGIKKAVCHLQLLS